MHFNPLAEPEIHPPSPNRTKARTMRLLPRLLAIMGRKPEINIDSLCKRIILPSVPVTEEEDAQAEHQDTGLRLARQEMWHDLCDRIETADHARQHTPGGESVARLIAYGARADVVTAVEDALHDGVTPDPCGIEALEQIYAELPESYACALIVALAHVDIGWAWRMTATDRSHADHETRFLTHFNRADELLSGFDGEALDAPQLLAAQCALLAARPQARRRVADDYEKLIALDPASPRHLRALGEALLPDRFGSYEVLELEARRMAARTGKVWGAGGYVWVYLDALARDAGALERLDATFFVDGMHDIVDRHGTQHVVNQLAAFCGIIMAPRKAQSGAAEGARARIHGCLDWLIKTRLQELHPLIWSQTLLQPGLTPALPSRRALVQKGRQTALRIIAQRVADEMSDGGSVAFSNCGMYRLPAL